MQRASLLSTQTIIEDNKGGGYEHYTTATKRSDGNLFQIERLFLQFGHITVKKNC
jgi:hypothetical protein